jgi:hypothetical protein
MVLRQGHSSKRTATLIDGVIEVLAERVN